jgi:hypothetical protein
MYTHRIYIANALASTTITSPPHRACPALHLAVDHTLNCSSLAKARAAYSTNSRMRAGT